MKCNWTKHSNEKHTADQTEWVFGLYLAKKFVNSDLLASLPNIITTVQLKTLLEECMSFSFFETNGPLFCKNEEHKTMAILPGSPPLRPFSWACCGRWECTQGDAGAQHHLPLGLKHPGFKLAHLFMAFQGQPIREYACHSLWPWSKMWHNFFGSGLKEQRKKELKIVSFLSYGLEGFIFQCTPLWANGIVLLPRTVWGYGNGDALLRGTNFSTELENKCTF